ARLPKELEPKTDEERRKARAKLIKGGSDEDEEKDDGPKAKIIKPRDRPVRIVFQIEDGRAVAKKITTGITSETEIEISEGLADGAEIVVGPYRALSKMLIPGTPVKVIETSGDAKPSAVPVAAEQPRAR